MGLETRVGLETRAGLETREGLGTREKQVICVEGGHDEPVNVFVFHFSGFEYPSPLKIR